MLLSLVGQLLVSMSFSFRSLFQRDGGSDERGQAVGSPFELAQAQVAATSPSYSMQAASNQQVPSGASPFQIGGNPLFKIASNEPIVAPPINSPQGMSPFSIAGATPTNAPLTVGDVIGQLPPEVVRGGSLPAEQPLSLPPALLENALRTGQPELPLFELYRVCPALFQMPISPQDPRLVPLPIAKLPGLIAKAREGQGAQQPQAPVAEPVPVASPFSVLPQTPSAGGAPAASPFQVASPNQEAGAQPAPSLAFPMSPFAAASPTFAAEQSASPASPFSIQPPDAPVPSPFGLSQAGSPVPAASPFSMGEPKPAHEATSPASLLGGVAGSPFGTIPAQQLPPQPGQQLSFAPAQNGMAAPFAPNVAATAAQGSLTGLFSPKPQEDHPDARPAPVAQQLSIGNGNGSTAGAMPKMAAFSPPTPVQAFSPPSSGYSGTVKLSFAALLNGCSMEELGFNPAMVPAWIMTNLPASTLHEQVATGGFVAELGALIDGVSDVGFRNTLSSARRGFQVKLPTNEVFHALTSSTQGGASSPAASFGQAMPAAEAPRSLSSAPGSAFVIQPGASAGQVNRMEAPVSPPMATQPVFVAKAPQVQPAASQAAPDAASQPSFAPKFGAPLNPFSQNQPTPALSPSLFGPPPTTPQGMPAQPQPGMSAFASFPPATTPAQPMLDALKPFMTMPGAAPVADGVKNSQQMAPSTAPITKPFDPFAAASAAGSLLANKPEPDSGFNSAQLLGQAPSSPPPFGSAFAPPAAAPESKPLSALFPSSASKASQPAEPFAPALEQPRFSPDQREPSSAPARDLFKPAASAPLFAESGFPAAQQAPMQAPQPAASPSSKLGAVKHSFLGLAPLDTHTDQLLLRALLGTEENLSAPRVVELLASQAGLSACVCLHGSHVLSHADRSKPDAAEFQRQAPEIARQLRGLAPLIGIDGAETFTLNAGGRLLTFCFPSSATVAVLHDNEPSTGLRDKITLIARELARMLG